MRNEFHRALHLERLEARIVMAAPQVVGTTMHVDGTDAADVFAWVQDSPKQLRVNNISYAVPENVRRVVIAGGGGHDAFTGWIPGNVELRPGQARLSGDSRELSIDAVESIKVYARPGSTVKFFDSAGADTFADRGAYARMFGPGYDNVAFGFATVTAVSSGQPDDVAWFYNLAGAHVFSGRETTARSFNATHQATGFGFAKVYSRGAGGEGDLAEMHGGAGNDRFLGRPGESRLIAATYHHAAYDFENVVARGGLAGNDAAEITGSAGNDELVTWPIFSRLTGAGFSIEANAFDSVVARAGDGFDTATLNDGETSDALESTPHASTLTTGNVSNTASGFDIVTARAGRGGEDTATLHDSAGDDHFELTDVTTALRGVGFDNRTSHFSEIFLNADQGGNDVAWLYNNPWLETYSGMSDIGALYGGAQTFIHVGVETVNLFMPSSGLLEPIARQSFLEPPPEDLDIYQWPGLFIPIVVSQNDPETWIVSIDRDLPTFEVNYYERAAGDLYAFGSRIASNATFPGPEFGTSPSFTVTVTPGAGVDEWEIDSSFGVHVNFTVPEGYLVGWRDDYPPANLVVQSVSIFSGLEAIYC